MIFLSSLYIKMSLVRFSLRYCYRLLVLSVYENKKNMWHWISYVFFEKSDKRRNFIIIYLVGRHAQIFRYFICFLYVRNRLEAVSHFSFICVMCNLRPLFSYYYQRSLASLVFVTYAVSSFISSSSSFLLAIFHYSCISKR